MAAPGQEAPPADRDRAGPPADLRGETVRWFARGAGFALGALLIYNLLAAAGLAVRALLLVFGAILLGSALEPMIGALRARLPIGRAAAILAVYLGFFVIVVGLVLIIVPDAFSQANQVSARLPQLLKNAHDWAAELRPRPLGQAVTTLVEAAQQSLASHGAPTVDTVVAVGTTVGETVVLLATLLTLVFFWLTEHARIQRYALAFAPADRRPGIRDAWNEVEARLGLWVRGQLILMATMAVMTGLVYTVIGLPAPLVLGLWAGVAEAIPIVGPLLGAIPALLLAATVSPQLLVLAGAVYVVLQFLEGNVLVPLIMRNTIGISPFLVLASLIVGAEVGGIAGAFLAVPVTAAAEVILERLQARDVPVPQDVSSSSPKADEGGDLTRSLPDSTGAGNAK